MSPQFFSIIIAMCHPLNIFLVFFQSKYFFNIFNTYIESWWNGCSEIRINFSIIEKKMCVWWMEKTSLDASVIYFWNFIYVFNIFIYLIIYYINLISTWYF